jgi:hypothetical protein
MPAYDFVESEASLSENTHLKRKLILNNSFYNINSLLDYSNLAFTAVLSLETFVDEQNDTLASSPYLFLNNPDINKINFIYPNATVLELFDEYSSTFFDLKTALGGYSSTLDADMMFLVFYKTF